MTVPRDLGLRKIGDKYIITSTPVAEMGVIAQPTVTLQNVDAKNFNVTDKVGRITGPARLSLTSDKLESFAVTLSNKNGEKFVIGYDQPADQYYIDRTKSGKVDFEKGFAARHTAPRFTKNNNVDITLIIDNASVEFFADNGLSVMTEVFFPAEIFSEMSLQSANHFKVSKMQFNKMKSIWK